MGRSILCENDIRPDSMQNEYKALYEEDLRSVLSRRDYFKECSCPACTNAERYKLFNKDGFQYCVCTVCETTYISPRPQPNDLSKFYATSLVYKLFLNKVMPATEQVRRFELFVPRVDRVIEVCRSLGFHRPALLEVGMGFGLFCQEARRREFFSEIIGIEPHVDLARLCLEKNLRVYNSMIEDVDLDELPKMDVICSFEVIEHIFDLSTFFNRARRMLRPNGLLVLTCPNGKGFDLTTLGSLSDTFNFQHLNYFNPNSMPLLLNSHGFDVIQIRTPGKLDVDLVRKAVVSGRLDLRHEPFLQRVLIDEFESLAQPFQDFLAKNLLSGHMEVVARSTAL